MTETGTTFIYCLNDPRDGRIRYVGKSDDPYVRWQKHLNDAVKARTYCSRWIKSLLVLRLTPELEVLEEIPMAGWQEIEKEYIRVFKMICIPLTNTSPGGEGFSAGHIVSPETRMKISGSHRGMTHSKESREKISAVQKGKRISAGHREKIVRALTGRAVLPETRLKIGTAQAGDKNHNFGKKASPELRAKLSASHKGRIPGMLGKRHSLEAREKIGEAVRLRWELKREEKLQNGNP